MALQEQFKRHGDYLFKHRGHLPLIIVVIGFIVFVLEILFPCENYSGFTKCFADCKDNRVNYEVCFLVGLLGVLIRAHVVGYAPDRTSGRNIHGQVADVLNTKGLYSIVRHPLYLGNLFMWLSVALLTGNAWFIVAFILFFALYYERIMYAEEVFLREKFKEEYIEWSNKTPAVLPKFNLYQKAEKKFNFKKVLKKEKNGIWALLGLFWFFELVEKNILSYQLEEGYWFETSIWFFAALATTIYYAILKVIKITKRKKA